MIKQKSEYSFSELILRIYLLLSLKNKLRYCFLILVIFLTSFFEILSIGSVIPFFAALSDSESLFINDKFSSIWNFLNIKSADELPLILSITFGSLAIMAAIARLLMTYLSALVNRSIVVEFGHLIFKSIIYKPFREHFKENSSNIIGVVSSKVDIFAATITALTAIFSSVLILLTVILFLMFIEPQLVLASITITFFLYFMITKFFNKILLNNSKTTAKNISDLIQITRETIDGIREVILNQSHEFYIESYDSKNYKLRTARAKNSVISIFPRFLIEGILLCCISIFAYQTMKVYGTINEVLPSMAVIIMALQRMFPLSQQLYHGWASVQGSIQSLIDTLGSINLDIVNHNSSNLSKNDISFDDKIVFENVSFGYEKERAKLFSNLNFEIPKGASVGIYGKTGSGKSTFTDLIMGFLFPEAGKIKIDAVELNESSASSWQAKISHVPQKIFIKDSDIASNISMSTQKEMSAEIDLHDVAKKSQLSSFIESLPNGFNTLVGEGGSSLSGGQIQRIGIARALYKKSQVIVKDEPTSSLDSKTEEKVIKTIHSLPDEITLFIVSHNLAVIEECDIKISLNDGFSIKYN